ncbi:glycosyltransferase family 4 protein [Flavobacteriaceae bacterium LMO-SS05]
MRIGLVLPTASGYTETFFSNKIQGLEQQGHTVILFVHSASPTSLALPNRVIVAPKLSGPLVQVGWVSLFSLLSSLLFHLKASSRLYQLHRAAGASVLYGLKQIVINSHILAERLDWLHFGFGTMALGREQVAKAIGAKMAVSFRGFDIGIYPIQHPGCYKQLWETVDKAHVISDDIKALVYQQGFKDQAPLVKITPAIDTQYFENKTSQFSSERTRFITIARLHWKKGLVYTLEALALLQEQGIPFQYTIIGEGDALEELKFTAYQLGIDQHITFRGKLAHEQVKDLLGQSQIYLQYSVQEGFCNSVLEAQAMGLLCVVSDAEGLSENVLDGVTGWVIPKRQPKLLARKLAEVIASSDNERQRMSQQAQHRVQVHFNLDLQNEAFASFYDLHH